MGANKNKNAPEQVATQGQSGGDARGRVQNVNAYQQQRFEDQQGPVVDTMGENYGRATEQGFKDYGDIMGAYKGFAGGKSMPHIGYSDPFASYGGFQDFSNTGGYSAGDISNLRARGVSPIRAAYANAERELGRGRSLQGGYSPNMAAAQVKMAREQGQSAADAVQNVEGGIVNQRNANKLAGLSGMSNIENSRLGADLDVGKFNASADMQGMANQLAAMQGMTSLYGTTPGMAGTFGNQLLSGMNTGADFGSAMAGHEAQAGALPGAYDTTIGKIGDISSAVYPWIDKIEGAFKKSPSTPNTATGPVPMVAPNTGPMFQESAPQGLAKIGNVNPQVSTSETYNVPYGGYNPSGGGMYKPPPYAGTGNRLQRMR